MSLDRITQGAIIPKPDRDIIISTTVFNTSTEAPRGYSDYPLLGATTLRLESTITPGDVQLAMIQITLETFSNIHSS